MGGVITSTGFYARYQDLPLRQYILDQARRRSRYPEIQEEYVQEAWLVVSTMPDDISDECCKDLVRRTIYSAYWQEHKVHLMGKQEK